MRVLVRQSVLQVRNVHVDDALVTTGSLALLAHADDNPVEPGEYAQALGIQLIQDFCDCLAGVHRRLKIAATHALVIVLQAENAISGGVL